MMYRRHRGPIITSVTTPARIEQVTRAIRATLEGDSSVVDEVFTPDVHASLTTTCWSAPCLAVEIEDRAGAFDDVELHPTRWRDLPDEIWVEWTASVFHVGPFSIEDVVIPASGRRTELHGITIAEFTADRISGFCQCWDCAALIDDPSGQERRSRRPSRRT